MFSGLNGPPPTKPTEKLKPKAVAGIRQGKPVTLLRALGLQETLAFRKVNTTKA